MSWTVSTSVNNSQSDSKWRHNTVRLELMKFYRNAGRVDKNVTFVDNNRFMLIETVVTFAGNREYTKLYSDGITTTTRLQLLNFYRNTGRVDKM